VSEVPLSPGQAWPARTRIPHVIGHIIISFTQVIGLTAGERWRDDLNGFRDFHTENGSSQGQDLALTSLFVRCLLGSSSGDRSNQARVGTRGEGAPLSTVALQSQQVTRPSREPARGVGIPFARRVVLPVSVNRLRTSLLALSLGCFLY